MKIYIILTYTGTALSRIIKMYTRDEFSHVSISLDSKLNQMFSFGRLNAYNPFKGGFVHEGVHIGTFKRFKNTSAEIYSLNVTEEQYKKIKDSIDDIKNCEKPYKFNLAGLFAVSINKKIRKKHSFYCAEFVKYIFKQAQVETNLPYIARPQDFKNIENIKLEYKGKLKDFK